MISFGYAYNNANQRTRVGLPDGSFWLYEYDALGQVKSGKRYWSDWTPVAGQQFEYGFDDIGNRTSTKAGGDSAGANLRSASYTNNTLNQITSRDVPGYVSIIGAATATATSVNVNNGSAYRRGEYFWKELSVGNTSASKWQSVTNRAVQSGTTNSVTGDVFLAKTAEVFGYDPDGNETNDGRWMFTWDAENRLTKVESLSTGPTASKRMVEFGYDWQGRMVRRTEYNGSIGSYVITNDLKFLHDGWHFLAELNATSNVLVRSYLWGSDLSGSMTGAGGVGGLLAMNSVANGVHFTCYDGNGNVTALVKGTDGSASAHYEYDPFGQSIRCTGALAKENPYRFSTKRADDATDLVHYEYRVYKASSGTWTSRDSLGDVAFFAQLILDNSDMDYANYVALLSESLKSPYAFTDNSPHTGFDLLGLATTKVASCEIVIWLGHNNTVPQNTINNADCSAAAVVSCGPTSKWKPATPTKQIPGTSQTPVGQTLTIHQAELRALAYFDKAVAHAKTLCKDDTCKCKCKTITVRIECDFGFDLIGRATLASGTCGKMKVVECNE